MIENLKAAESEIKDQRAKLIDKLLSFAPHDVVFFWSNNTELQKEQMAKWSPVLTWINQTLYTDFCATLELQSPTQNFNQSEIIKKRLELFSDKELTAFYAAALEMRSLVLAFALILKHISSRQAFELSQLEELYEQKKWGTDEFLRSRNATLLENLQKITDYLNA